VDRAAQAVKAHPEFHEIRIVVRENGNSAGWFDQKKLERALSNLLLNACEAVSRASGWVEVEITQLPGAAEIRVSDNGRGVPESIQKTLFEPFVSCGKENGTGLGLTVVQKIIQDHGGDVTIERTSDQGTVFKLSLPLISLSERPVGETIEGRLSTPPVGPVIRSDRE
jgi:signal transduction histidine kinase